MTEFLSCDWGTSSFRLRSISGERIVQEYRDATGCRSLFDRGGERAKVYAEFLRGVLERWTGQGQGLPLVISGMASSTIGWKEVAYGSVPFRLDGSSWRWETLEWEKPPLVGETYLLSGLATERDIMRGEETEAIGLLRQISLPEKCTLLLPGTHSKHVAIGHDAIIDFTTHMTGELFDVLSRHSILKATVTADAPLEQAAFDAGVVEARRRGLGASLFQTRARAVLRGTSPASNASFLSGALIGAEVACLEEGSVFIGGSPELRRLYVRAVQVLDNARLRWHEFPDEQVIGAVPKGHAAFLECLNSR